MQMAGSMHRLKNIHSAETIAETGSDIHSDAASMHATRFTLSQSASAVTWQQIIIGQLLPGFPRLRQVPRSKLWISAVLYYLLCFYPKPIQLFKISEYLSKRNTYKEGTVFQLENVAVCSTVVNNGPDSLTRVEVIVIL